MKKSLIYSIIFVLIALFAITGCTTYRNSMREPDNMVNFNKKDFAFSDQISATAKTTKIFGININFKRYFVHKSGYVSSKLESSIDFAEIPVIGNIVLNRTKNIALYSLMHDNPNYDVVFYPRFETYVKKPILGIGFFYKKTKVKVTARLGRLKK